MIFGERYSGQASATCIGVAPSDCATSLSCVDCNGVKPPSGKKGTQAIFGAASLSTSASSSRFARLYKFCTQAMGVIFWATAIAGGGIIYLFEEWLRPAIERGELEAILTPWWQRFSGPYLYYPDRRLIPSPLNAFIDFIRELNG